MSDSRITRSQAKGDKNLQSSIEEFNPFASRSKIPKDEDFIIPSTSTGIDKTIKTKREFNSPSISSESDSDKESSTDSVKTLRSVATANTMAAQNVKIKDAVTFIPNFDGHNIPLSEFIEAVNEAKEMVSKESEANLVKLIRTKITGEARRTMVNKTFENVATLVKHFKDLYGTGETLQQLFGKLGYEVQRSNEKVIPFANRLREIGSRIFEKRKSADGSITDAIKTEVESIIMDCFRRGLKPEIEARLPEDIAPEVIMKEAVRIEKQLDSRESLLTSVQRNDLKKGVNHLCQICSQEGHSTEECNRKLCRFCNKPGHSEDRCFTKARTQVASCQICNKPGHVATNCYRLTKCQICNQPGHTSTNCKRSFALATVISCQICNKPGHTANMCYRLKNQMPSNQRSVDVICQICNKPGHTASTCRTQNQWSRGTPDKTIIECSYCKNKGHHISECRKLQYQNQQLSGNEKNLPTQNARKEIPSQQARSLNTLDCTELLSELLPLE